MLINLLSDAVTFDAYILSPDKSQISSSPNAFVNVKPETITLGEDIFMQSNEFAPASITVLNLFSPIIESSFVSTTMFSW